MLASITSERLLVEREVEDRYQTQMNDMQRKLLSAQRQAMQLRDVAMRMASTTGTTGTPHVQSE